MGLRVGGEGGPRQILDQLVRNLNRVQRAQEQLSTGLRANRASQDPAGVTLSEILRGQLAGVSQAVDNVQRAEALTRTAEGALAEQSDLLVRARGLAVAAANTGGGSPEQTAALQGELDQVLQSLDRIADTTRFADRPLLNGDADFRTGPLPPEIDRINLTRAEADGNGETRVDVDLASTATSATAAGTISATQSAESEVRLTGSRGSEVLRFAAGATRDQVEQAINAVSGNTGVEAAGGEIRATEPGSDNFVQVEELSGDLEGISPGRTEGADAVATVNGETAAARGNTLQVDTATLSGEITVDSGAAPGQFGFTVTGGGLTFQLAEDPTAADRTRVGFGTLSSATLGESSGAGSLADLRTGGAASLAEDPGAALRILDAAAAEVSGVRQNLGALSSGTLQPRVNALGVALENLAAGESSIRDADVAESVLEQTRAQLLGEAGISALRQHNLQAQNVLDLLG